MQLLLMIGKREMIRSMKSSGVTHDTSHLRQPSTNNSKSCERRRREKNSINNAMQCFIKCINASLITTKEAKTGDKRQSMCVQGATDDCEKAENLEASRNPLFSGQFFVKFFLGQFFSGHLWYDKGQKPFRHFSGYIRRG